MPRRFPHLRGDSRLYPFAARTALRRRQKHRAWALRLCGAAVLCLAAGLILRDTVFRGGQPEAGKISIFDYSQIIFATLLGFLLFAEIPDRSHHCVAANVQEHQFTTLPFSI